MFTDTGFVIYLTGSYLQRSHKHCSHCCLAIKFFFLFKFVIVSGIIVKQLFPSVFPFPHTPVWMPFCNVSVKHSPFLLPARPDQVFHRASVQKLPDWRVLRWLPPVRHWHSSFYSRGAAPTPGEPKSSLRQPPIPAGALLSSTAKG